MLFCFVFISYHNVFTKLKNFCEFVTHRVFQMFCFCLSHLARWKIENFFAKNWTKSRKLIDPSNHLFKPEKFQDFQIILTHWFACFTRLNNIADEIWPFLWPFMFQNLMNEQNEWIHWKFFSLIYLNKNNIQFIEINFFSLHQFGILWMWNDQTNDVLFNRWNSKIFQLFFVLHSIFTFALFFR